MNLERELAHNYPDGPRTDVARKSTPSSGGSERSQTATGASVSRPAGSSALAGDAGVAGGSRSAGKKEIRVGMSPEEVRSILGKPKDEVVFGNRSKWVYPALTVVFENGRVKDVQF